MDSYEHIQLSPKEVQEAVDLGNVTHTVFQRQRGHYRNLMSSHIIGKLGELAVLRWLSRFLDGDALDPLFRDTTKLSACDIAVLGHDPSRLDVKTWNRDSWPTMGRCVTPAQLPKLKRKCDAIVWCYLEQDFSKDLLHRPVSTSVIIAGWSTIDDIASTAVRSTGPAHYLVENHQLSEEELRPLATLYRGL